MKQAVHESDGLTLRYGAKFVALSALVGLGVSVANYFSRDSGIAGEPGTLLVMASTSLLVLAGFVLATPLGGRALRGFFVVAALLDILGTGFAAYMLESQVLMGAMAISLVGWLVYLFGPR